MMRQGLLTMVFRLAKTDDEFDFKPIKINKNETVF